MLDLHNRVAVWDVGYRLGVREARLPFRTSASRPGGDPPRLSGDPRRHCDGHAAGYHAGDGDFMEADTTDLPAPDAVFIGGHGDWRTCCVRSTA